MIHFLPPYGAKVGPWRQNLVERLSFEQEPVVPLRCVPPSCGQSLPPKQRKRLKNGAFFLLLLLSQIQNNILPSFLFHKMNIIF